MKILLRIVTVIILLITAIATVVLAHTSSDDPAIVSSFDIYLDVMLVLPLAFFAYMAIRMATQISQLLTVLVVATVVSAFGLYYIIVIFYFNPTPDALDGLVFFAVPIIQWIGGVITIGIVYFIGKRKLLKNQASGADHPTPPPIA